VTPGRPAAASRRCRDCPLATATTQISDTWNALQQLDAKDELSQAFASSDSCEGMN